MFSLRFASCSQPGVEGATPSQPGSRVLRLLLLLAVTTGVEAATLTSLDVGGGGEEPVEVALPEHELKRHIRLHPENAYPALYERKPGFIVDTGVIFTEPVEITSHHNTKIDAAKSILRQQSVIPSTERFGILAGPGIYVAWDDQWVPRSRQLSGEDEGTYTRMAFTQYPVKAILFICAEYWDVDQRNQRNPIGSATPAELLSQYDLIVLVKCHLQFPEGGEPPKALFAQLGLIPPGKESTIPSDHKHVSIFQQVWAGRGFRSVRMVEEWYRGALGFL